MLDRFHSVRSEPSLAAKNNPGLYPRGLKPLRVGRLVQPLLEQSLGSLRELLVVLLNLPEKVGEFGVAITLGVTDVLLVGDSPLERVIEHADQVVVFVARAGVRVSHSASTLSDGF